MLKHILNIRVVFNCLLMLMISFTLAPRFTEVFIHEILGTIFFLFILYHVYINRWFLQGLFKQKNYFFIYRDILMMLTIICMFVVFISGILISQYVFAFIPKYNTLLIHQIHTASTACLVMLVGMHLGLHLQGIFTLLKENLSPTISNCLFILTLIICANGVRFFIEDNIFMKIIMEQAFSFFDFDRSIVLFIIDTLSVVYLFTVISFFLTKLSLRLSMPK